MPATFEVYRTYPSTDRGWYVIEGRILSGEISTGMSIHISLNQQIDMTMPIAVVESSSDSNGGPILLRVAIEEDDELDFLQQLDITGEVVMIQEAT